MSKPEPDNVRCAIARTIQVLGDKWTALIVREAFGGHSRFGEFRARLGIPSDILTARLVDLVEAGVLERRAYREPGARERFGYHLTAAGEDLLPVLGSLAQWGDEHRPSGYGPSPTYRHAVTGEPVHVAFVTADERVVARDEIDTSPAPDSGAGESDPGLPVHPLAHVEAAARD